MAKLERSCSWVPVRGLDHLKSWIGVRPRAIVLGTVLLAPSVWMLSVIPPLWRDLDAFIQLTHPPDLLTIVHFGPLYCFGARIPLYLGYAIDTLRANKPLPSPVFFIHPKLNNLGVFLLLLSQHVALFCSAFYFIISVSRLFWVRLVLATLWASSPLFYTFAQCVGSETLSMIFLLLVGAVGLRIVQHSRSVGWKRWLLCGVLLWLSILTRHINAVLAAVLPLTFLFLSGYWLITISVNRSQSLGRWRRLRMRQALKKAAVAVAVGVVSIGLANLSLRGLCRVAHVPYYSTFGITVMFRLDFLVKLPLESRNQFLNEMAQNSPFVEVKKAIPLLRESFSKGADNWDSKTVMAYLREKDAEKAMPLFREVFPQGDAGVQDAEKFLEKADSAFSGPLLLVVLNQTAKAFLFPPSKVYLSAVAEDFRKTQTTTIPNLVSHLFLTTIANFFPPADKIARHVPLRTYRNSNPNQIVAVLEKHRYFGLWKKVNHIAFLCFWAANLSLLAVLAQVRRKWVAPVVCYTVALTLVGLLIMLANCILSSFLPRYTLSMWELTILSLLILLGLMLELLTAKRGKFASLILLRSPRLPACRLRSQNAHKKGGDSHSNPSCD